MTLVLEDRAVDRGQAIAAATLRCIARWGWGKTTVDDIAREAGVGRATLYRQFPGGREAVLDTVITTEVDRLLGVIDEATRGAGSLEDLVAGMMTAAHDFLVGHAALQFVLAHEPEIVLPHVSFQPMDDILGIVARTVGPRLEPWVGDAEVAARGAEWLARILLAYLFCPSPTVDFDDRGSVRHFVRTYVVPGLRPV